MSVIECAVCDAREEIGSEINERTLEDAGWQFDFSETLCPDHANPVAEKDGGIFCGHCDEFTDHATNNCVLPIVSG